MIGVEQYVYAFFPLCGADMTKDETLTMIIASIAMEELAFGHIVNAEGEKLQYVLGALPGGQGTCASTQEVLAVNKSAAELLDTVMQSQMLLKGKLEKALEAGGHTPAPEPPGPGEPPCGVPCCQKSAVQLVSRCNGFPWDNGFLLTWKCREHRGCGIRWNGENPAQVELDPEKTYALNFAINVRGPYRGGSAGGIFVRLAPRDAFSDILPLRFSTKGLGCEPLTLHYSTTLFPQAHPVPCAELSLLLKYGGSLFVEQASLNIFEI